MNADTLLFALRYLAFIPVTLLVAVILHEMAHLLAARALGIPAREFAIGFGPPVASAVLRRSGLILRLRAVPLGGYVRLDERRWNAARARSRILIMLAGIAANFTTAALIIFVHAMTWPGSVAVEDVLISSTTSESGFEPGDRIVAVTNRRADLHIGNAAQLSVILRISDGIDTTFTVRRGADTVSIDAVPKRGGIEGVRGTRTANHRIIEYPRSVMRATGDALLFNPLMFATTARGIANYLRGGHRPEITGIVGAAKLSGQLIELTGVSYALIIAASLNFSIATLNMLPLPLLDGGKILIALIERTAGRRFSDRHIQAANHLSMAVIIAALTITLLYDLNSHIF